MVVFVPVTSFCIKALPKNYSKKKIGLIFPSQIVYNTISCAIGWLEHASYCYFFRSEKKGWKDSLSFCENQQASLLSLGDIEENLFIINNTQDHYYWIGLNDIQEEGTFNWSDNTTLLFVNWKLQSKEPNGGIKENCVLINSNGLWIDYSCNENFMSICKLKKVSLNSKEVAVINKRNEKRKKTKKKLIKKNGFTGFNDQSNNAVHVDLIREKNNIVFSKLNEHASLTKILTGPPKNPQNDLFNGSKGNIDKKHKRARRYVLQGTKWDKKNITWRLLDVNDKIFSRYDAENALQEAFSIWENYSDLSFQKLNFSLKSEADIEIKFVERYHDDPYPFSDNSKASAHAFYPHDQKGLTTQRTVFLGLTTQCAVFSGLTTQREVFLAKVLGILKNIFKNAKRRTSELDSQVIFILIIIIVSLKNRFFFSALHEIGHSLGLDHTHFKDAVMFPLIKSNSFVKLSEDDILGIQALYGPPKKNKTIVVPISSLPTKNPTVSNKKLSACPDVDTDTARCEVVDADNCTNDSECINIDEKCCSDGCSRYCIKIKNKIGFFYVEEMICIMESKHE
ncbi:uncharacterized protein LOC136083199 [Hydra vulgaris]|uniref:Uncharacterized protein LOC136083199 n=1 Tax=Hydra vulgaris TaxID=6087 RepID=A0ABM4CAJ5_HYDVU